MRSRTFATEEAKAAPEHPAQELSENEKKLTGEVEQLTKEVETLSEKNKELDVSKQTARHKPALTVDVPG